MTYLRRGVCRFAPKTKVGILFVCAVIASTSVSLTVTSPAEALSGSLGHSQYFAGYVAWASTSTSNGTAQVSFDVPTLACTQENKNQVLYIFQYVDVGEGLYADAFVAAQCDLGSPSYGAGAGVCAYSGCAQCAGFSVAPGDSVTLLENVGNGMEAPSGAAVVDNTSGNATGSCEVYGNVPAALIYTGICGQDLGNASPASTGSATPPPFGGCQSGKRPEFSPVAFNGAIINSQSLGSLSPSRYDMYANTTLQVKTRNLKVGGESFNDVFVHH
jgi:hypothetical protein